MSASIDKALYVGVTPFGVADYVRLKMNSGEVVEGTIEGFIGNSKVQIEVENGWKEIDVTDIESCIS